MSDMYVIKRGGQYEEISFDKILTRVKTLGMEAKLNLNYSSLVMKVIDKLCNNIKTTQIDLETADQCASLSTQHSDYGILAGRILISNHHKSTSGSFTSVMSALHHYKDLQTGEHAPLINERMWKTIEDNCEELDDMIVHERDYLIDYFGFKTLERAYLLNIGGSPLERPQYMWSVSYTHLTLPTKRIV